MKPLAALWFAVALFGCSQQPSPASELDAETPAAEAQKEDDRLATREELMALCDRWGALARTTMDARQAGVPMRKLIDGMNPGDSSEAMTRIIVLAYESPRYHTDEHQQREITEFENRVYAACLRENNLP